MSDWYNDDAFWETFESYMFTPERIESARVEVDGMTGLLGIRNGAKILDLCCGPGRHSLEFARRGFDVTGVDRTRAYLDKARGIAAAEGLSIAFVEADMREFVRPDTFDAAINFFSAFGYFDDPADDLKVARHLRTSLKPGGRLILDVIGKETLAARFRARDWSRRGDAIMLEERRLLDGWKRIESKWTWIRGDERRESTLTLRLYSGAELEKHAARSGIRQGRPVRTVERDTLRRNRRAADRRRYATGVTPVLDVKAALRCRAAGVTPALNDKAAHRAGDSSSMPRRQRRAASILGAGVTPCKPAQGFTFNNATINRFA